MTHIENEGGILVWKIQQALLNTEYKLVSLEVHPGSSHEAFVI